MGFDKLSLRLDCGGFPAIGIASVGAWSGIALLGFDKLLD
jgi:hypothetical protein